MGKKQNTFSVDGLTLTVLDDTHLHTFMFGKHGKVEHSRMGYMCDGCTRHITLEDDAIIEVSASLFAEYEKKFSFQLGQSF